MKDSLEITIREATGIMHEQREHIHEDMSSPSGLRRSCRDRLLKIRNAIDEAVDALRADIRENPYPPRRATGGYEAVAVAVTESEATEC